MTGGVWGLAIEGCHFEGGAQGNPRALRFELRFGAVHSEGELTKKRGGGLT